MPPKRPMNDIKAPKNTKIYPMPILNVSLSSNGLSIWYRTISRPGKKNMMSAIQPPASELARPRSGNEIEAYATKILRNAAIAIRRGSYIDVVRVPNAIPSSLRRNGMIKSEYVISKSPPIDHLAINAVIDPAGSPVRTLDVMFLPEYARYPEIATGM